MCLLPRGVCQQWDCWVIFVVCRLFDGGRSDWCHHVFYIHSSLHRHLVAYNFWLKLQSKFQVSVNPPTLFFRIIWLFSFICLSTEIFSSISIYVQKSLAEFQTGIVWNWWICMGATDILIILNFSTCEHTMCPHFVRSYLRNHIALSFLPLFYQD